jgi:hypothetical protein
MDAYDMYQLINKNLADSVAIYGRGREIFRPPTYSLTCGDKIGCESGDWINVAVVCEYV